MGETWGCYTNWNKIKKDNVWYHFCIIFLKANFIELEIENRIMVPMLPSICQLAADVINLYDSLKNKYLSQIPLGLLYTSLEIYRL